VSVFCFDGSGESLSHLFLGRAFDANKVLDECKG